MEQAPELAGNPKDEQIANAKERIASLEAIVERLAGQAGQEDRRNKVAELLKEEKAKLEELER